MKKVSSELGAPPVSDPPTVEQVQPQSSLDIALDKSSNED